MSTILLRRARGMHDLIRDYKVFLDDREVAHISHGGECRFTVAPGAHRIQLRIDWCSSPELRVHVGEGEEFIMDCGNNVSNPLAVLVYITLWRGKYLWLAALGPSRQRTAVAARVVEKPA